MSQQTAKPLMSRSSATWLAWYMCALTLALTALSLVLLALNLSHPGIHIYEPWDQHSVIAVAFSTVGAVIVSRRSETTVGWIFCSIGLLAGVVHLSSAYAVYALLAEPGSLPGGEVAAWMRSWIWVPYLGLFVFLFLLYPDGRAQSNRWRWFARLVGVVVLVGAITAAYSPGPIDAIDPVENPLGIELLEVVDANAAVGPVETLLFALGLIAVVSLFARMRRARAVERQQLKWFAYATTVLLSGTILAYTVAEATNIWWLWWVGYILSTIGLVGLPVSMGIAILRYRLYEIDLIINRTLVYGALTAMLGVLYFVDIVVFQEVFRAITGQTSQLAVVASTLIIAALFNPLRRRIQEFIDRRFYRRKYDARKTLEAFGSRLRYQTDLERISEDLLEVVDETMQPSHLSLWLRFPDSSSPRRSEGGSREVSSSIQSEPPPPQ